MIVDDSTGKDDESYFQLVFKAFKKNRLAKAGAAIFLVVCLVALFSPLIAPFDPLAINVRENFQPPSLKHLMGTDSYGRDVFSRIIHGAQISIRIGSGVVILSVLVGTLLGLAASWVKALDNIIMRIMDGLMAFPAIVLALAVRAALGPQEINLVIALTITQIPRIARIVRSSVLRTIELGYIESARAVGVKDLRMLFLHVLPNSIGPLIVQASFTFSTVVLAEAGLSFIGVGAPPPAPSWGSIISEGRNYIRTAPWLTVYPGVVIVITVIGLNMLGDGLRDILDPKMRGKGS
jgi:peptide/nickel transport system permease protein